MPHTQQPALSNREHLTRLGLHHRGAMRADLDRLHQLDWKLNHAVPASPQAEYAKLHNAINRTRSDIRARGAAYHPFGIELPRVPALRDAWRAHDQAADTHDAVADADALTRIHRLWAH